MKTRRRLNRGNPTRGERGIALVIALWVMVLLSLLGATFLSISATESTIASNETNTARAFNIAEAGLERAKARVKNGTETSLNAFLPGPPAPPVGSPGPNLYTDQAFDNGTYSVVIQDDNDDANQGTDINNRVLIRSTGTLGTAQKLLVALVEKTPLGPLGAPRGAAEIVTTAGSSWEYGADGGSSFDGRDWTPPADIAACGDGPCGTLPNPNAAATHGGFTNTASGAVDLGAAGTMYGTGCLPPCDGTPGPPSKGTDTTIPSTHWDNTISQLKAKALPGDNLPSADLSSATTYTWGTPAAPKIMVISGTGTINWQATVNGAGVLIVETTSGNFNFSGSGTLNWQGLVFVRSLAAGGGDCCGQFQIENATGRIRVFGQVVNASVDAPQVELNGSNKNYIRYSTTAMDLARGLLGPAFAVRNWQEVAIQ